MNLKGLADRYMRKPDKTKEIVFRRGVTEDIIKVILYADRLIAEDTVRFAKFFESGNQYTGLKTLWEFVRYKIRYELDPVGDEKIQLPSYLWKTKQGDCKSKSLFIGSVLKNLDIPYAYRFAAYQGAGVNGIGRLKDEISRLFSVPKTPLAVTHVYVVAYPGTQDEIIIDSVYDNFDAEYPFKYAIDYNPGTQTFNKIASIGEKPEKPPMPGNLFKIVAGIAGIYFINQYLKNANSN